MIKEWLKQLQDFSQIQGIELEIIRNPKSNDPGGIALPGKITLFLHKHLLKFKSGLFSIYFHEWAHIQCYKNNKYKIYHTLKDKYTEKEKHIIKYTGLRAERYCDKIASLEMKSNFPKLTYQHSYNTVNGVEWYRKWSDKIFI